MGMAAVLLQGDADFGHHLILTESVTGFIISRLKDIELAALFPKTSNLSSVND
jgi:hypothetical protein